MKAESIDPFARATTQAREAIYAARDMQESIRATRRRVRLQGLIMSWRRRPVPNAAAQSERLALILDVVRDEAEAPMGNIQIFEGNALHIRAASDLSEAFLAHFAEVSDGKCACGAAFRQAAPVVVDDVNTSSLFSERDREMLLATGIQACQSLALVHGRTKLGAISLHYREVNIPSRRQAAFVALASEIGEAVSLAVGVRPDDQP